MLTQSPNVAMVTSINLPLLRAGHNINSLKSGAQLSADTFIGVYILHVKLTRTFHKILQIDTTLSSDGRQTFFGVAKPL